MITPEIVNLLSFIIFISLVFLPTKRFISNLLKSKIATIYHNINKSKKIRKRAEAQLKNAIRDSKAVDKKCAEILEFTHKRIASAKAAAENKLIELAKKRQELIKQSLAYYYQLEDTKLRDYILECTFAEVKKELEIHNLKYNMQNNKSELYSLISTLVH